MRILTALIFAVAVLGQQPAVRRPAATPAPAKVAPAKPAPAKTEEQRRVEEILQLLAAGLGEPIVLAKVRSYGNATAVSTDDLVRLKKAGASDAVVLALIDPAAAPAAAAPPPPAAPAPPAKVDPPVEAPKSAFPDFPKAFGLYYLSGDAWVAMPQTQCKLQVNKIRAIMGGKLMRQKVHANLPGAAAATRITATDRPRFLAFFPDRKVSTFNVLRLISKEGPNLREVAQLSVMFSTEQYQDKVEIEIAPAGPPNMFLITPKENLSPGEYGVVEPPPTSNTEKVALFDVWDFGIGARGQAGAPGAAR